MFAYIVLCSLHNEGVGDRIHLSDPQNETRADGSSCWIVEKVSLTTTTVFWGTTNEKATLSNGAIANMRVINAARSPNATLYVTMKFGIDTPYEKIAIFRSAVEQFLKDRPREWLTFIGFRPTEVVVDQAYIGMSSCIFFIQNSVDSESRDKFLPFFSFYSSLPFFSPI